ncbi:MAG: ABC transporter permease, partial [Lachnospiraceae bacterium]|nr:ABC transporter permease [Lachnospiraceae bacterium]
STGIQNYISRIEEDTLSSYPLTIQETTVDVSSMVVGLMNEQNKEVEREEGRIYSRDIMNDMLEVMSTELKKNNLKDFKEYLESDRNSARDSINAIQYSYNLKLNLYKQTAENSYIQVNPSQVMNALGMGQMMEQEDSFMSSMGGSSYATNTDVWIELLNNDELLKSQYDLLAGKWPESYNEVMLIATSDNSISDYTLYALGLKNQSELAQKIKDLQEGKTVSGDDQTSYSYDELLNISFKLLLNTDYYQKQGNMWVDQSDNNEYMTKLLNSAEEIKIAGIIRPNEESLIAQTGTGGIGYTSDLEEYVINKINSTEIAEKQKATPETNIFTGMPFAITTGVGTGSAIDYSTLTAEQRTYIQNLSQVELAELMRQYTSNTNATYESNLQKLGIVDITDPSAISIYPSSFKGKEQIEQMIENYNQDKINQGNDEDTIEYTDLVGMMMSSVSSIVDVVSYVLIAFVSISLIVSSIMIGIITYISVLERTKEIGILRSIGASKQDVSRVFNAETFIVGLVSGLIGIGVTLLLCIPINIIIKALVDVSNIAKLPLTGAVILVVISMLLTMFAGLIPSKMASKRDPVEALRSE